MENIERTDRQTIDAKVDDLIEVKHGNLFLRNVKAIFVAGRNILPISSTEPYPVGAVYISVVSTSPATLFGGTWSAFGTGRTIVGIDSSDTDFDSVEETGGHKAMQQHTHSKTMNISPEGTNPTASYFVPVQGTVSTTRVLTMGDAGTGDSQNLQPYIVTYMWKRTA